MVLISEKPTVIYSSPFAKAFYELDNKIKGKSGLTTRQRVRELIRISTGISERTLSRILVDVEKLNVVFDKNDKHAISVIMDVSVRDLFPKTKTTE